MTCKYTSPYEVRYLLHVKLYCTASVPAVFHFAYSIRRVCHDGGSIVLRRATYNKSGTLTLDLAKDNILLGDDAHMHVIHHLNHWSTHLTVYM